MESNTINMEKKLNISLPGSHYNNAPVGFVGIKQEEFARIFFMYILKAQISKFVCRDHNGDDLSESFSSIRFWEIDYPGWEGMGIAMAYKKDKMRYFRFGEDDRWIKNENKFATQFARDNS